MLGPAHCLLSLANGGYPCAAVDTIRHRTRFMPVEGRKALVVFTGRADGSVVGFYWSVSTLRPIFSHLVGVLTGNAFPGLKPSALPSLLSVYFIPTKKCVRLYWENGAMIKAAYAVGYTPMRQESTQETDSSLLSSHRNLTHDSERNLKVRDLIAFTLIQLVNSQCNILNVSYFCVAG